MAKTNMIEREKRRAKIVKKYAAKRAGLKELIRSPKTNPEVRADAQVEAAEAAARRQPQRAVATVARLPAAHAACIAASAWRASRFAKPWRVANCRAFPRRAGKEHMA